jgi:hypothetical protein
MPLKPVQVDLVDAGGATILRRQLAPGWQVRFDLSGKTIARGSYFLRIVADGKQFVSKVMKL